MDCSPWDSPGQITGAGSCFPSPEHLPDAGIEHRSPALWADSLPTGPPGKPDDEAEAYLALAFYLGTSLSQTCTMGSGDLVARLPWWLKQKRIQLSIQYRRLGFDPWVGKRMATHSSLLAWRIPWTEDPSGLHSGVGGGGVSKESDTTERLHHRQHPGGHVENFSKNVHPHPWLQLRLPCQEQWSSALTTL